jgi:hypothetical protein
MIGLGVAFLVLLGLMASGGKAKAATGAPGAPGAPPTKGGIRVEEMPAALQQELAAALTALTVNADGKVVGPVDAAAIQLATATAGDLERAGYADAAAALRAFIKAAATLVPRWPIEKQVPLPSSMPADLQAQINRALQLERDPAKLLAILNALKAYQPQTPDIQNAIGMLQALILQVQAQQSAKDALNQISTVVNTPPDAHITPSAGPGTSTINPSTGYAQYHTQPHDTGSSISRAFTGDANRWRELLAVNPSTKSDKYGMAFNSGIAILNIPRNWPSAPHGGTAYAPPAPSYPTPGQPGQRTYTVRSGDTGSSIAKYYTGNPNRWPELVTANPETKDAKYGMKAYQGKVLKIPASWPDAGGAPAQQVVMTPLPDSPLSVPSSPLPGVSPIPRTPVEMAADAMVRNLKAVQAAYPFPSVKGKEDQSIVKRFQAAVGGGADGKAGPGTLLAAAVAGQSDLPLVMYWPTSASASRVLQYRNDINGVADRADAGGDHAGAAALRASAARERGQAGIVGPHPA